MILDDCVTSGDNLPKYVSEENAAQIAVCHDGHTFYVGYPTWDGLVRDGINSDSIVSKTPTVHNLQINPLPGGTNDELDGTKWKGVTLEDLVIRYVRETLSTLKYLTINYVALMGGGAQTLAGMAILCEITLTRRQHRRN